MMNFDDNKPYPDDVALLKLLGLPAWQAALHQETFVGEAFPYEPDEQPGEETLGLRRFRRLRLGGRGGGLASLLRRALFLFGEPLFQAHPCLGRALRLVGALRVRHLPLAHAGTP